MTADRILIIGGHGHVAKHFTQHATEKGRHVDSVIRREDQAADVVKWGGNPIVADVTSLRPSQWDDLVNSHDAVVWSAGAGGKGSPEDTYAIDRDACKDLVDAIARSPHGPRFVLISWCGSPDHGVPSDNDFFPYADAKADADRHTMGSTAKWTILGPVTLSHDPATGIRVLEEGEDYKGTTVSREAVAQAALVCLDDETTVGRFIRFCDGSQPIAEAI
ncbi:NAD(P)H-binding protein [Cutibacterium avidum]|uniref:NAD(P)H-binding protein n=1 Tax=Cutibacterium avidum TaxID=33010 RepID=UPI00083E8509|nr:NAD(P)H-binding protein [Cutibacterium avidum]AOG27735.1 nucleoside-diphosphate sugar epimerase [Cutibacterium avidum]